MAGAKALKRQKIALQFMPICDNTQQHMHSCGYNPLLELTVSLSKKASSVHQHLCAKWSQAQLGHDIYVMIPTCPGSSQYCYLDLQTEAQLTTLLANWAGCSQLQLLYGFKKHAIPPVALDAQSPDEGASFLQELGLGVDTCMAVLTQSEYTSSRQPQREHHSTTTTTTTSTSIAVTAVITSSAIPAMIPSTSTTSTATASAKPTTKPDRQKQRDDSNEFHHFDCHDPGDAQSFLLPDGTNTILATAAAMLGSNTILAAGGDEPDKNDVVLTPQKAAREDTKPFAFEDSLASFGALFPDDSSRALILENLSLLYSPSAAHTNHSVHSARGQRRPQAKDGKVGSELSTSTRRNLATSSPFKAAVKTAETNISSVQCGAAAALSANSSQPGKENEAEIRSPFAAIIAMHNASPKGVDAKMIPHEQVQRYSSPAHEATNTSAWKPEDSQSGSKRRYTPHSQDSNSATKRRQTPLSQEAKQRKRIRPTFVGSLDSATLRASRNDSFVR